jgi:hypothetical protein
MSSPLTAQINAIPQASARMRAALAARARGALPPNSVILQDGSILDGSPDMADETTLVALAQATEANVFRNPFHSFRFGQVVNVEGRTLGVGRNVANVQVDGDPADVLTQCAIVAPGLTQGDRVLLAFDPPHAFYVIGILGGGRPLVNFSLGQEGDASIPADEPAVFALGINPSLGGIDVIEAVVATAVGPTGTDETWRVYDVDSDETIVTFTVTGNGGAAFGTGVISADWSLSAPGRYAVETTVLGDGTPSIGLSVTVAGTYNQVVGV